MILYCDFNHELSEGRFVVHDVRDAKEGDVVTLMDGELLTVRAVLEPVLGGWIGRVDEDTWKPLLTPLPVVGPEIGLCDPA